MAATPVIRESPYIEYMHRLLRISALLTGVALTFVLAACSFIPHQAATTLATTPPETPVAAPSSEIPKADTPVDITSAPEVPVTPETSEATEAPKTAINQIQQFLTELPTKGRAPKTGYSRSEFGQRWSDDVSVEFGHNGCDTRNDILRRDLINTALKPNTRDCVVLTGDLQDPYTARTIYFQRGQDTSSLVQIDHVVALSDAWQKGAQQLTAEDRQNLANDPLNLLAVDGTANQQKRDSDAASWLPANKAFRCEYVARQVVVKHKYGLWTTDAEHEALRRWLDTCSIDNETALSALIDPN